MATGRRTCSIGTTRFGRQNSIGIWTAWSTQLTEVQLKKGKNTIRLGALGPQGLVNIDHFVFQFQRQ